MRREEETEGQIHSLQTYYSSFGDLAYRASHLLI